MALRLSKALRNYMMEGGSLKHAMADCVLKVYTGSQPATAEAAPTGTLLVTYSKSGGALTREVRSQGKVTLTGGASGSVDSITVDSKEILGSAVAFDTDLATTAAKVATAINNNPKNHLFEAAVLSGAEITLTAKHGLGTLPNGWVVAGSGTTITLSYVNMGTTTAGVNAANGLKWGDSAAGVLVKHPDEVWQGTAVATGTAGWFRFEASVTDAGALDSAEAVKRIDGSVANSGAELNMASTAIVSAAVQTISSFSLTLPTA